MCEEDKDVSSQQGLKNDSDGTLFFRELIKFVLHQKWKIN